MEQRIEDYSVLEATAAAAGSGGVGVAAGGGAASLVTPAKLADLLMERGPLAIRYINQALTESVPLFKDLSTSKQRRLVMGAMELGDQERCMVFKKVGWGLWTVERVAPESFIEVRDATNRRNSKVRENVRENTDTTAKNEPAVPAVPAVPTVPTLSVPQRRKTVAKPTTQSDGGSPPHAMYIDENALASDDDDDDEDDHRNDIQAGEEDAGGKMYSFNRRASGVVYADRPSAEMFEQDLLAQKMRPLIKNRSRRSSSKNRPPVHLVPGTGAGTTGGAGSASASASAQDAKQRGKMYGSANSTSLELVAEAVPRRSSSRLSVSKESSIRSTLLAGQPQKPVFKPPPPPPAPAPAPAIEAAHEENAEHHSDTEDEDWEQLGPQELLRSGPAAPQSTDEAAQLLLSLNR
ncbi:uncharacterized protein KNAG_0A02780 [Huiozyma naganishii CBS 8797]|uniref:Uncharacterized protein n=1 Tax=Huiozyma naganishii (strain ATCC MYA-139 / BCRC 22969 / CBS 8797 / KCTC 17520 / NBRC 10181 / NCYC 3082 / Yp74L-3) TaxID=1071383 RepID=J7RTE1_HUIN7|nr:hypothetical protein KNAG_0A02780 [Kazachstania naganishii CBS 8797]CCK67967.1 hypothetical protein KNAG_0A02780 [Kazachstania naganishii CBS 8797]